MQLIPEYETNQNEIHTTHNDVIKPRQQKKKNTLLNGEDEREDIYQIGIKYAQINDDDTDQQTLDNIDQFLADND